MNCNGVMKILSSVWLQFFLVVAYKVVTFLRIAINYEKPRVLNFKWNWYSRGFSSRNHYCRNWRLGNKQCNCRGCQLRKIKHNFIVVPRSESLQSFDHWRFNTFVEGELNFLYFLFRIQFIFWIECCHKNKYEPQGSLAL